MNQPDTDRILASLQALLAERFDIPAASAMPDSPLRDLGLDSMMVMDVMLDAEDRLGVKLNDLAMPRDATLGDVVKLIQRNLEVGA